MKQGWEIKKLGEVLKVQNGYAFNSKLFTTETGTPLIRIRDIKKGIGTETNFNGPYDKKYEVKAGDFLIGMDGEFGCYEWKGDTALLNQRVCRLQEFSNKLHPRFLFYGINKYLKAIEDVTAYATVKHISSKQIEAIEIPLPPLPEQHRIVSILDEAFAAIAKAKANAEQNLKNAKELFESYLQGVFENKGDGWEEQLFENCFKLKSGDNLTAKNMSEGEYPVFGGNGIAGYHNDYNLSGNNVIIGRVGALCGNVRHITENIWLTDNAFKVVDFKFDFDQSFLTYLLNHKDLRSYARQAAQPVISNSSLKDVVLCFPKSKTEQQTIVRQLDALRAETKRLEAIYQQKLLNLEELKKSVMQRAFNGELN